MKRINENEVIRKQIFNVNSLSIYTAILTFTHAISYINPDNPPTATTSECEASKKVTFQTYTYQYLDPCSVLLT